MCPSGRTSTMDSRDHERPVVLPQYSLPGVGAPGSVVSHNQHVEEMTRCDFCNLDAFRQESTLVRENGFCLFASGAAREGESQSLLWGSGIIVPKVHRETVLDLSPDEFMATRDLLLSVRPLLEELYQPDGYTVGWNCFAASGQAVPHAHLHVLLRYTDEPLAGKGIRWFFRQPENLRPDPFSKGRCGTRFLGQAD